MKYIDTFNERFLNETKINIDTKVVDKNGKPLIMYHGGSFAGGEFKGVGWFTISKQDAKYYAEQNDGILTKAYIQIKNPLYTGHIKHLNIKPTEDMILSAKKRNIRLGIEDGILTFIEPNEGVLIAMDIGRDGIIDLNDGDVLDAVIFNSNQIIPL